MDTLHATPPADLEEALRAAKGQYHRLILLVGSAGSGKTPLLRELSQRHGFPTINLNLTLSKRLLDLTVKERPLRVSRILSAVVADHLAEIILLDNIELLFEPSLQQSTLACLQALSRNRTIVAAWPGTYDGRFLTYAEPGHPEYRRYESPDASVLTLP